jgi:aminopeptidase N
MFKFGRDKENIPVIGFRVLMMNEKVVFNLNVEYNKDYQVISNGILKFKSTLDGLSVWQYKCKTNEFVLLMLAIGKFEKSVKKIKIRNFLRNVFEKTQLNLNQL